MGILWDIYENFRKTSTDKESNKPKERKYDFDGGFTGDKKIDCPVYKPSEQPKKQKDIKEKEGEDR